VRAVSISLDARWAVESRPDVETLAFEVAAHQFDQVLFVVDDQDVCHASA